MDVLWQLILAGIAIFLLYIVISAWKILRSPYNNPVEYLQHQKQSGSNDHQKLVLIGDSITHGHVSADYAQMLRERLTRVHVSPSIDVINAGINSELAYNALQRVDKVIQCDPDVVTILIGTNDANGALTPKRQVEHQKKMKLPELPTAERFRAYLTELITRLTNETRAKVAILSLPTMNEDPSAPEFVQTLHYSAYIQEVASETGITYLPLNEAMVADLKANPSHPKYSFKHELLIMLKSIFAHGFGKSWANVARGNGFRLHTDFLHLSPTGARMVAEFIENFCKDAGIIA